MGLLDGLRNIRRQQESSSIDLPAMSSEEVDRILQEEVYQNQAELEARFKLLEKERQKEIELEQNEEKRLALSKKLLEEARFRQEYLYPKVTSKGSSSANLKGVLDALVASGDTGAKNIRDMLEQVIDTNANANSPTQSLDERMGEIFSSMGSNKPGPSITSEIDTLLSSKLVTQVSKPSLADSMDSLLGDIKERSTAVPKKSLLDSLNDL
jgi:hypothetical protein